MKQAHAGAHTLAFSLSIRPVAHATTVHSLLARSHTDAHRADAVEHDAALCAHALQARLVGAGRLNDADALRPATASSVSTQFRADN